MKAIRTILIANRGEIAVRVIRACREMGIRSIAVFSEADRRALHVRLADMAYPIGPPPARESYLDSEKIIDACKRSGADAVHPGYGFLSENEDFAEACERAGIVWIGPPAAAIRLMGQKTSARRTVGAVGVPVVPGEQGPDGGGLASVDAALTAARRLGFPVLVKAVAGGGGKGMRLVKDEAELGRAYPSAQREAKAAFGDDAVYLEKAIQGPRHVEIQVFADAHGHVVHLGERDCSIQRRHQKVIEESPSPALDAQLRARMGEVAIAATRACGYVGAGTIEFLLDSKRSFYFLEMNTRLQVEHPVTEMLTGLDLVQLQIRVARGESLGFEQADVVLRGAALECRIYAEDSIKFLPSPGTLTAFRLADGPFVRNDAGVESGSLVTPYYDPLLSKLVVWGQDRMQTLARARRALAETVISGIRHNVPFLKRVLNHPAFASGQYGTDFIERFKADLCSPLAPDPEIQEVGLVVAAIHAARQMESLEEKSISGEPSAWSKSARWREG